MNAFIATSLSKVCLLFLIFALTGCATVQQEAVRTDATGIEYRLTQRTTVTAGGKLKDGQTDFKASYNAGNWEVASGTASEGAWSPDTVAALSGLAVSLAPYLLEGLQAKLNAPQQPDEPDAVDQLTGALVDRLTGTP